MKNKNNLIKKLAKERLLSEMRGFSHDYWCAGWLFDLEYVIWEAILNPPKTKKEFIESRFNPGNISYMKELSDICKGWWIWDTDKIEQKFVDLKEWDKMYKEWIQKGNK